jgi:hypothetical protein
MPREIFGYTGETAAQKAARLRQEQEMVNRQRQQLQDQNQARMIQQQKDQQKALEAQRMASIAGASLLAAQNTSSARARDLLEQRSEEQFKVAQALEKEYKESDKVWVPKGKSGNISILDPDNDDDKDKDKDKDKDDDDDKDVDVDVDVDKDKDTSDDFPFFDIFSPYRNEQRYAGPTVLEVDAPSHGLLDYSQWMPSQGSGLLGSPQQRAMFADQGAHWQPQWQGGGYGYQPPQGVTYAPDYQTVDTTTDTTDTTTDTTNTTGVDPNSIVYNWVDSRGNPRSGNFMEFTRGNQERMYPGTINTGYNWDWLQNPASTGTREVYGQGDYNFPARTPNILDFDVNYETPNVDYSTGGNLPMNLGLLGVGIQ